MAPKTGIVMLATPEIEAYARHTKAGWRDYAARHGYEFRSESRRLIPDMHINWSKIELVRRTLAAKEFDILLLVDADTIIVDPARRLESILAAYPDKSLLFCADTTRRAGAHFPLNMKGAAICRTTRPPNAGFILMRVGKFVAGFFDEWLALARGPMAHWADIHPRNQNVLWRGLFRRHRKKVGVLDKEVARCGVNETLDRIALDCDGAFVVHDKRLPLEAERARALLRYHRARSTLRSAASAPLRRGAVSAAAGQAGR
ncbi:MAG: hypothetical protein GC153_00955 [Alphaproteobacteria bacterium]|nr:hypothetical protein [Alphaproteobacteria bacterium]